MSAGKILSEPIPPEIKGTIASARSLDQLLTFDPEHILQSRLVTINSLLDIAYQYLDQFGQGRALCKFETPECDAMIYGGIVLQLMPHKLWPKTNAHALRSNVNSLVEFLGPLVYQHYPSNGYGTGRDHYACKGVNFKTAVDEVMSKVSPSGLLCHKLHMDSRGKADYLRKRKSDTITE